MAKCPACNEEIGPFLERRLAFTSKSVRHSCGATIQVKPAIVWAVVLFGSTAGGFGINPLIQYGTWVGSVVAVTGIIVAVTACMFLAVRAGFLSEVNPTEDSAVGYRLVLLLLVIIGAAGLWFGLGMRSGA